MSAHDPAGPRVTCDFAHHDAAYVLGSLSPAERAEFERHLSGCDDCARRIRELAGLPGLLSRVPADVLESPDRVEPVPETLLPRLVAEVRRAQRRRTTRVAVLVSAAAVLVTAGAAAVVATIEGDGTTEAAPSGPVTAPALPLQSVGSESVTGAVSLTGVDWGTRLDLTCSYEERYESPHVSTYALFVRTTDGRVEQVATWRALPGRSMRLAAATAATPDEIASVVVRTADGEPVLRLPH